MYLSILFMREVLPENDDYNIEEEKLIKNIEMIWNKMKIYCFPKNIQNITIFFDIDHICHYFLQYFHIFLNKPFQAYSNHIYLIYCFHSYI